MSIEVADRNRPNFSQTLFVSDASSARNEMASKEYWYSLVLDE